MGGSIPFASILAVEPSNPLAFRVRAFIRVSLSTRQRLLFLSTVAFPCLDDLAGPASSWMTRLGTFVLAAL
jgi:hypothetical protein